jgi:glycosyltransferase involved in cell wall biosynthesis
MYRLSLRAVHCADHIVTDSEFTRQRLEQYDLSLSNRVQTLYPGVDGAVFRPFEMIQQRAWLQNSGIMLNPDDFIVIYVGAEYSRKNIPDLIKAFALIRSYVPSARLIKVGASHSPIADQKRQQLLRQYNLIEGKDVIIVEHVDDELLATLYNAANVFVSTSKYEGFGFPLLEALSCGTPAVVSRVGSLPELGGDVAFYVDVTAGAAAYAEIVRRIASKCATVPTRTQMTHQAARFRWQNTIDGMLQVLERTQGTTKF